MNPSIVNTVKLHIDREEMLARLSSGPASVNAGGKECREKISVTVGN